jgi:hypothetical protein
VVASQTPSEERTPLSAEFGDLVLSLAQEFHPVDTETIDLIVRAMADELAGSRIRTFVPLLVERASRERLIHLTRTGRVTRPRPEST